MKEYLTNYLRMILAATTSGLACTLASLLFGAMYVMEYIAEGSFLVQFVVLFFAWVGAFLAYRVFSFMRNPAQPLTIENVHKMSVERTERNLATIAVTIPLILLKMLIIKMIELIGPAKAFLMSLMN